MNARVLLLVVVTGLFMGAWDGDQAAIRVAVAKRAQLKQQSISARCIASDTVVVASASRHKLASMPVSRPSKQTAGPAKNLHGRAIDDIPCTLFPLPGSVSAGDYQAVSQSGETLRVCVTRESAVTAVKRDFYMVDAKDGGRWYLIRIQ